MSVSVLPRVSPAWAERFARETFGVAAQAVAIGGFEDRNFVLHADGRRYVLKLCATSAPMHALKSQHRAMRRLADLPGVAVPTPLPARDGQDVVDAVVDATNVRVRLLSFVDGVSLRELPHLPLGLLREVGTLAGRVVTRLEGFTHDLAGEWDLRSAAGMLAECASKIADREHRALAERAVARADAALVPLRPALREAVVHGDLTDENVLAERGSGGDPRLCGVIDFGDLCRSWLVGELAVVASSLVGRRPDVSTLVELARGFHAVTPLREEEIDALVPLVTLRAAAAAVQTELRAAADPENEHLGGLVQREWATLAAAVGLSPIARAAVRAACGLAPSAATADVKSCLARCDAAPIVDGLDSATPVVDLSVRTDLLSFGAWRDPAAVADSIERVAGTGVALGRYGEARIVHDRGAEIGEPATLHLGVDVFAAAATTVRAPLAGRVRLAGEGHLVVDHGRFSTHVAGIAPSVLDGVAVDRGEPIGTIAPPPPGATLPAHLHVQLCCEPWETVPHRVPASLAEAWRGVCPDPSAMLGVAASAPVEHPAAALALRRRVIASPQAHYYVHPPEIVRGWRQWLYDSHARAYLDIVNNVAVLGHSHPRVAAAAARQLELLNTNSRFVYASMNRFAEALIDLLPDPLEVVFLVSSGSEANDLALQLVRQATGHGGVIALDGAYHGWTSATADVSTHLPANPDRRRPAAVETLLSPTAVESGTLPAKDVATAADRLQAKGFGLAGFVCEALSGVGGGIALPDGYLRNVYAAVRERGGLCIADEVQTGYGRLGEHFWAFEQQGVVPDVVCIGKSTGNGHPVAAVITTRQIADRFAERATWFSSVGGGPVSCEVGLAVLATLREEELQENALTVGAHLRTRLEELVERHPICSTVHGIGLYLGLELVRDRVTGAPAREEAYAVCERMLELGVIVQPTGDRENILKIKPPLVITRNDAELLVERLDYVLATTWLP